MKKFIVALLLCLTTNAFPQSNVGNLGTYTNGNAVLRDSVVWPELTFPDSLGLKAVDGDTVTRIRRNPDGSGLDSTRSLFSTLKRGSAGVFREAQARASNSSGTPGIYQWKIRVGKNGNYFNENIQFAWAGTYTVSPYLTDDSLGGMLLVGPRHNLLVDPSFERGLIGGTQMGWDIDNGGPSVVTTNPKGDGRYVLRLANSTGDAVKSDTLRLKAGQVILFGGSVWARGQSTSLDLYTGGASVLSLTPTYASSWQTLSTIFRVPSDANYLVKITSGVSINDTSRWDNIFAIPIGDSILPEKKILFDSLVSYIVGLGDNNLVTNPSFEEGSANWTIVGAGATATKQTSSDTKHGRYYITFTGGSVSSQLQSDTMQLLAGQHVIFGALERGGSGSSQLRLVREGGTVVSTAIPTAGFSLGVWDYAVGEVKLAVGGAHWLEMNSSSLVSTDWDGAFVTPLWTTTSGDTIQAGVGACAGTGPLVDTVFAKDSVSGAAVPDFAVTVFDSATGLTRMAGPVYTDGNGLARFQLADATPYKIRGFAAGKKIAYAALNCDTIIRLAGVGGRDTIKINGASPPLPFVTGKTTLYGNVQDIFGDTIITNVEVSISYDFEGTVKCCVGGDSSIVIVENIATIKPDKNGQWAKPLYPTAKLIPNTKYRVVISRNGKPKIDRRVTLPDQASPFKFNP